MTPFQSETINMTRKRWTPSAENNHQTQTLRNKKKWQIALRRYVLEGQKSSQYAPYFGLGITMFRNWIEAQFDPAMNWENFSAVWQLDHVIPTAYFDQEDEKDLQLCWNFINIRPGRNTGEESESPRIDAMTAKAYFNYLLEQTGLAQCAAMLAKISTMEAAQTSLATQAAAFIQAHKEQLEIMPQFDAVDYERLNSGTPFKDLAFEKAFFKKFA